MLEYAVRVLHFGSAFNKGFLQQMPSIPSQGIINETSATINTIAAEIQSKLQDFYVTQATGNFKRRQISAHLCY
jgi:hypothetical protein